MKTFAEAIEAIFIIRARLLRLSANTPHAQLKSDCELSISDLALLSAFLVARLHSDPTDSPPHQPTTQETTP